MATPTMKPKFDLTVEWENKDGLWLPATSERNFDVPDEIGSIKVTVVGDDGKSSADHERRFKRLVVKDERDSLNLLQSNKYLALASQNYGLDLFARGTIKGPIAAEVEGPGKTIRKLADQIFASRQKLGKPISQERALELAAAMSEE